LREAPQCIVHSAPNCRKKRRSCRSAAMMPRHPSFQTHPNIQHLPGPMSSQATRLSFGQTSGQAAWDATRHAPAPRQAPVPRQAPFPAPEPPKVDMQREGSKDQFRRRDVPPAYRPLMKEEASSKEEWVERAHCSACSRSIDELFSDKKQRKVQQLKQDMFEQIYDAVGGEVAPEDLMSALVVRNAKFNPITACCLALLTLGIFCFFRPRDDDAVIVLTRQERVLLAKDERPSFCRGQALPALLTFLRYLIVLLLILSMPSIFFILAFKRWGHDAMSTDELQFLLNVQMDLEKQFIHRLRRNYVAVGCIGVATFLGLLFWLWINSPQDYGTRIRQSHAASTVCGGQLSLTGSEYRRRGVLRLYFGKYPTQTLLDSQLSLRSGQVVGPVQRADVNASGFLGGSGMGREATPAAIIAFTIMLSVVTLLDSSFSWIDRSWAVARVATMSEFCIQAPSDPFTGRENCTRALCEEWTLTKHDVEPSLCRDVKWYDDPQDEENVLMCEMYGHPSPPCCGGCLANGVMGYFSNGLEAFKGTLSVLADVGTLIFSFIAARHVMNAAQSRDVVDLVFVRSPGFRSQTSNLEFTQPIAAAFLESVFTMGRDKTANDGPRPKGAEESGKAWGNGIKEFSINDEAKDWDEFFAQDSLVSPGHSRWTPLVNIPQHCLGILDGERVLAAWTETPQVTLVHILPNIVFAVLLLVALLFFPQSTSADTFLIPNMGKGLFARVVSALLTSVVFLLASLALTHLCLFTAVQHVVIVTDLRIFYVRYRGRCWLLCMMGMELRVDAFRHDRDVFYGRMNSTNISLLQRIAGVRWVPGEVFIQMKFGMLKLTRARGDALDIYNVISQLTRKPDFLTRKDLEDVGVSWDECQSWVNDMLTRRASELWSIAGQDDDFIGQSPDILLTCSAEQPIFHWSFKENGALGSPHNTNTDVVVTTGRVLLWNRTLYKRFDCKTSCCLFLGGVCQCALCNWMLQRKRLPSSMSFVALAGLMSFTTETTMEPPVWYDPEHPPVKVRCFDEICEAITRCLTCDPRGMRCGSGACDLCPRRAGPRAQLRMAWQAKFNAQQPEPDLECSIRPFALPDNADVGLLTTLGLRGAFGTDRCAQRNNAARVEALQKIMGVVQGLTSRGP